MIHICYALYDKDGKYSKNVGTSMLSVFEHTNEWITIHLLHDNSLTEQNKTLFIKLVRKYGQHICFYNMDKLDLPYMESIAAWGAKERFSKAAFYRLLVGEVLPSDVQRCIYLDSDIIVNLDIKKLWEEDLNGAPLGAISEAETLHGNMEPKEIIDDGTVEIHRYFNSGVLLIDIAAYSTVKNIIENGLALLEKHPKYTLHDQDILNYYFAATYQQLAINYNLFVDYERLMKRKITSAIYHYAGVTALNVYNDDVFNNLWTKYYTMSPWFAEYSFCEACHISTTAMVDLINLFWKFARRRSLTLVGSNDDKDRFQELLNLGQGDRFLSLYDKPNRINIGRIIAIMKKYNSDSIRQKPLYMFVSLYYSQFSQKISEAGFEEGIDFINATWLIDALEHHYPQGISNFVWAKI